MITFLVDTCSVQNGKTNLKCTYQILFQTFVLNPSAREQQVLPSRTEYLEAITE
jgi:hypothetical protein